MGSLFWGSSIAHISTTTARIDINIFALNCPCSDLSNAPAYVSARCVVVARRPDLHRHGHGTVPPNLPPPYLPHFPSVQHVLGICRMPLIPSYYTSNTRVVKTTSLLSIFPSLVAASFRICHHCLHHISKSA